MNASNISKWLSMKSYQYSDVGTDRVSKNGKLLGGIYENTVWSKSLTREKIDAEDMLFENFVGWFSSGSINMNSVLESNLMQKTSELDMKGFSCSARHFYGGMCGNGLFYKGF